MDVPLFAALLLAHLLADFVLQTTRSVAHKHQPRYFLAHIGAVTALSYVIVGVWPAWWLVLGVGAAHGVLDLIKTRFGSNTSNPWFWSDQIAHLAVIAVATWLGSRVWPIDGSMWAELFGADEFAHALVFGCGLVAVVWMGGIVVGLAVRPYLTTVQHAAAQLPLGLDVPPVPPPSRGLTQGGRLIGQLERGLIFFFVLIHEPASVAFLVAAKSVFRFGELKDRHNRVEAEYILIGTLMSFAWGLVLSRATQLVLDAI